MKIRKPYLALAAAITLAGIAAVDNSTASGSFSKEVVIPDLAPVSQPMTKSMEPGLIDLGGVSATNARVMALVSIAARQVAMAKTAPGAQQVAKDLAAANYNWGSSQFQCLTSLWNSESHWNFQSMNHRSGALGIAQALPAAKMASAGSDWATNPITQIKWGLGYIKARYGNPCTAWSHHRWSGSY
jgi:hypothetical protein